MQRLGVAHTSEEVSFWLLGGGGLYVVTFCLWQYFTFHNYNFFAYPFIHSYNYTVAEKFESRSFRVWTGLSFGGHLLV